MSFTTDYGLADGFVAACHGVLARLAPQTRILDVTHQVPPQAVTAGAAVLAQTVPYLPQAVHLVVVDPGVGTTRRGVVVAAEQGLLVGPDNGVLLPAAEALGGIRAAVELTEPQWWLPQVSQTFHGRDIFAPVAAWLARGIAPQRLGPPVPVSELLRPPEPECTVDGDAVRAEVVTIDHFGNLQLALPAERSPHRPGTRLRLHAGPVTAEARMATTFADVAAGECLVLADSAGQLAVAVNGGSAAERLGAGRGLLVQLEPAAT
ncbi:hypothetical protein DFQ14_102340 [Halopolyspora algeriensis]|uniref:SAM-dependent chlorinase/fluorinase n=1 Tax=Halopolyspora algeriensis TaxID=1500506 RepID=A0A368W231_9ACTN|nr:hypothetical protein DFQ14_102340 [Halopolyspora algeriensis]TQM55450.1 hypothetical protein FHU43_0214 [Halopolyspora algeriensis]